MSTQFDHVSILKKANVFFDGKCISYNLTFPDQSKKTVGVILPGTLRFSTVSPELREVVAGKCRVRLNGESDWQTLEAGQRFHIPGASQFDIEVSEPVHYVCSFVHA